jgi:hypothetical protein
MEGKPKGKDKDIDGKIILKKGAKIRTGSYRLG